MKNDRVRAVDRALIILSVFSKKKRQFTLSELSQATALPMSTLVRLVRTLEYHNFLIRKNSREYEIGKRIWQLGILFDGKEDREVLIRSELNFLAMETKETASFYIADGESRVCLYRKNSPRSVRHHLEEGVKFPIHIGATGQILSCYLDEKIEGKDKPQFVISLGKRDPDIAAIAVPVFTRENIFIGALSVSGIITRFNEETNQSMVSRLIEASKRLKENLI